MKYDLKHCLVAIVGPTAAGKSEFALQLAQSLRGEIVNADSRQVYRYMDIGTNKPTLAERALVPHHLIDVVDPDEDFSLAIYCKLATKVIKGIQKEEKLPLLVGGSGLYIWALVEGWKIAQVPPDQELRHQLETRAEQEGGYTLYQELQNIDLASAAKIHPGNTRRIIRALEIYQKTGQPPSQLWAKEKPAFPILIIGLTLKRGELYRRIDSRVDKMIQKGLIEETEELLKRGYSLALPSMSSIGYKQLGDLLQGGMTLSEAIDKIKYETHRLARHQYAWFRPSDTRIHWFDVNYLSEILSFPPSVLSEATNLIKSFALKGEFEFNLRI